MDEFELRKQVIKLKASDENAFKAIATYFHQSIFSFLVFRLNDSHDAEDILQETFVRLWENRKKLNEELSVKSFLFTTASNLSLNLIRHKKVVLRFTTTADVQRILVQTPYHQLEFTELQDSINRAINAMSEKVRMVFLLCKVDEVSYKEAALQLNISVATVESHMVKALRVIREELDKLNK